MLDFKIEELKLEDLEETMKVIEVTFLKFEAPECSEEGVENFFKFANYGTIKDCYNTLKEIKSSVIKKDYNRMKQFIIDNN